MPAARRAARGGAREPESHARDHRGAGGGQDRSAQVRDQCGTGLPGRARGGRGVGNGAGLRGTSSVVCADAGSARAATGAAARSARDRPRSKRRRRPGSLPAGAGRTGPALRGGGRPAPLVRSRRCPVGGSGLGADPGVRGAARVGGVGRDLVRDATSKRRAAAAADHEPRRSGARSGAPAAAVGCEQPAG
jgi:hypothetical protein